MCNVVKFFFSRWILPKMKKIWSLNSDVPLEAVFLAVALPSLSIACCIVICGYRILCRQRWGPKGLTNLGNTCYMNAILQMLSRCPKLNTELKDIKLAEFCKMTRSIRNLLKWNRPCCPLRTFDPNDVLKAALERYQFNKHNQQDSFEMFNAIVTGIETEMIKLIGPKKGNKTDEETIMQNCTGVRLFYGNFITVYKYSSCKHIDCKFQSFSSIPVPILKKENEIEQLQEDTENLWRCLETKRSNLPTTDLERGIIHGLFKTEKYKEETLFCSKCEKYDTEGSCWKRMLIYEPPHIMVLHIDRSESREDGGRGMTKRNDCVTYPEMLNVDSFCSIASEVSGKLRYNLFGVVAHSGSLDCGHYITYIKNKDQCSADWYKELCKQLWKDPSKVKDTIECTLEKIEDKDKPHPYGKITNKTEESITIGESNWNMINDSTVTGCKREEAMNNQNAYILMYEKCD